MKIDIEDLREELQIERREGNVQGAKYVEGLIKRAERKRAEEIFYSRYSFGEAEKEKVFSYEDIVKAWVFIDAKDGDARDVSMIFNDFIIELRGNSP